MEQKSVISKKFDFVNKSLFPVVELKRSIPRPFYSRPAQLQRFGEPLEVGNEANSVRVSRRGQIWSVKHEQLRFASLFYLQPLTVPQTVKANQPLRQDVIANSKKRGWT